MPAALAYLGSLAFAAFVLWLRARRAETVTERLGKFAEQIEAQRVALEGFGVTIEAARRSAFDSVAREGLEAVAGTLAGLQEQLSGLGDRVESLTLKSGLDPRKRAA